MASAAMAAGHVRNSEMVCIDIERASANTIIHSYDVVSN